MLYWERERERERERGGGGGRVRGVKNKIICPSFPRLTNTAGKTETYF